MFEKTYSVNCDICDTRKMKEEDYSGYEKILLNADVILVNEKSKSILNRLPITINADAFIELEEGVEVELKTANGSYEIAPDTMVKEHTILVVNGSLLIHPGTGDVLARYEKVVVNGCAKCPKSLESYTGKWVMNGMLTLYPEDCTILKPHFEMERYFPLRAKADAKYYAEKEVIIADATLDLNKLVEKNVQFVTKKMLICEELIETGVQLVDETVELDVIPAGMQYVAEDIELSETLAERYGKRIYVNGDVTVSNGCDFERLKNSIEEMVVRGTITLGKSREEALRTCNIKYGNLEYRFEGRVIQNKVKVKVDNALLMNASGKVLVMNSAYVKIANDVEPQTITEKLVLKNCASVNCTPEQESAVSLIAENVATIGSEEDNALSNFLTSKVINADEHIM